MLGRHDWTVGESRFSRGPRQCCLCACHVSKEKPIPPRGPLSSDQNRHAPRDRMGPVGADAFGGEDVRVPPAVEAETPGPHAKPDRGLRMNRHPSACSCRWSARRRARATMVRVGGTPPVVGKTDDPARYRLSRPWTRQSASQTPFCGVSPIRVVPM